MSAFPSPESSFSTVFAAEIETATVALVWHYPDWCPHLLRSLDPAVHLFQPYLRTILEAINIAYSELNWVSWPTVVTVIRELGAYEACGGADGLNAVYAAVEPTVYDWPVFEHYIDMLKRYAVARTHQVPIRRFVRGDFLIEPNKLKHSDSAPDYVGSGKFSGLTCRVMGYQNQQGIKLSILPI